MYVLIYTNKCNMRHLNNGFNKFKMDDLTNVKILIVQEMWKNSLNHSSIIAMHWATYILISARCNLWIMILTY